jgi:hypothetical protein
MRVGALAMVLAMFGSAGPSGQHLPDWPGEGQGQCKTGNGESTPHREIDEPKLPGIRIRQTEGAATGSIIRLHREFCHPKFSLACKSSRFNRRLLAITDTELKLIAAAAIIGLSSRPKNGYSTPAAIGTPRAL